MSTVKNAKTTSKPTKATLSPVPIGNFKVLDTAPAPRRAAGRAKGTLRMAIEGLEVNRFMDTGIDVLTLEDENDEPLTEELRKKEEERILGNIRSTTNAISQADATKGRRFTVYVAENGHVIVGRKEDSTKDDEEV